MIWILGALLAGCSDDDPIYDTCTEPADCVVPEEATAVCLEKSDEGYCSWECAVDGDCAEDTGDSDRICASFESDDAMYCFPSCEDDGESCPDGLSCRSTGGGSENRKVCFPDSSDTTN
ncbi:MAG: hypothetical protein ACI8RZ_003001 [Myxococcota bacterium]|jgi:hypothetical protein